MGVIKNTSYKPPRRSINSHSDCALESTCFPPNATGRIKQISKKKNLERQNDLKNPTKGFIQPVKEKNPVFINTNKIIENHFDEKQKKTKKSIYHINIIKFLINFFLYFKKNHLLLKTKF